MKDDKLAELINPEEHTNKEDLFEKKILGISYSINKKKMRLPTNTTSNNMNNGKNKKKINSTSTKNFFSSGGNNKSDKNLNIKNNNIDRLVKSPNTKPSNTNNVNNNSTINKIPNLNLQIIQHTNTTNNKNNNSIGIITYNNTCTNFNKFHNKYNENNSANNRMGSYTNKSANKISCNINNNKNRTISQNNQNIFKQNLTTLSTACDELKMNYSKVNFSNTAYRTLGTEFSVERSSNILSGQSSKNSFRKNEIVILPKSGKHKYYPLICNNISGISYTKYYSQKKE